MFRFAFALGAGIAAFPPVAAAAQDEPVSQTQNASLLEERASEIAAVLRGDKPPESVFAPSFLAAVPPAQIAVLNQQLTAQFGEVEGVEKVEREGNLEGVVYLRFKRAIGSGKLVLSPQSPHKVTGLQLSNFELIGDGPEKIAADLEALSGEVSVLFTPLGTGKLPIMSVDAKAQMPIGSTFKLYVLSALARSIELGERGWDDTVTLNVQSFPSGMMQGWPQGSPVTLQTLATMMISISDNTATDQLIRELSREAVEAEVARIGHSDPSGLRPFLTTLELFALKADTDVGALFAKSDEAGQRRIVGELQDEAGWSAQNIVGPTFVEPTMTGSLEWFASVTDIAALMATLADFDDPTVRSIMAVNPAMPKAVAEKWSYIGYKGGSEPGVLNLSWLLIDHEKVPHALTMSWRNPEANLMHSKFELLAQRIVGLAD
ncbi:serine hydrolase [Altererythrobacter sp.]|nr:serine hydrolase [Altererythrobacter sp.]